MVGGSTFDLQNKNKKTGQRAKRSFHVCPARPGIQFLCGCARRNHTARDWNWRAESACPRPVGHLSLSHSHTSMPSTDHGVPSTYPPLGYLHHSSAQLERTKRTHLGPLLLCFCFPTESPQPQALALCPLPSSPPMPPPPPLLEPRDYLGAGATSSCCSSCCSSGREGAGPHLALRLGLPGSDDSPGRGADTEHARAHVDAALTLGPAPAPAPAPPRVGAKRGFADSRDRCAKRDATAADDAAGGVTGEEKRVGAAAAGAPPAAK